MKNLFGKDLCVPAPAHLGRAYCPVSRGNEKYRCIMLSRHFNSFLGYFAVSRILFVDRECLGSVLTLFGLVDFICGPFKEEQESLKILYHIC